MEWEDTSMESLQSREGQNFNLTHTGYGNGYCYGYGYFYGNDCGYGYSYGSVVLAMLYSGGSMVISGNT
jgi:hypothetical protein